MIYKKYEFSLSLNGTRLVHIARNPAGIVVFREDSEKALKEAIDRAEEEQRRQEELEAKKREERKKKREQRAQEASEEISEIKPKTATALTRGSDGKFISRAQQEEDEPKKKGFWEKLTE